MRYVVSATMDIDMELDADSPEDAKAIVAKAFNYQLPFDPMSNVTITIERETGKMASIKTAILQEWSVPAMDAWEAV